MRNGTKLQNYSRMQRWKTTIYIFLPPVMYPATLKEQSAVETPDLPAGNKFINPPNKA